MWNYFRLENEHLYNVGKFRAVRNISIGPIRRVEDNVIHLDSVNENDDNRDDDNNDDGLVETHDHDV